jgi:aminoglycoside 3-N-acetyltransferase
MLGAPLDTVTLVHHAEAVAHVAGKRRVTWRVPLVVDGVRTWVTLHDIDTSAGALEYAAITDGADYVEWFVRGALHAGVGRAGSLGTGAGHVLDAAPLVAHVVDRIEGAFARY